MYYYNKFYNFIIVILYSLILISIINIYYFIPLYLQDINEININLVYINTDEIKEFKKYDMNNMKELENNFHDITKPLRNILLRESKNKQAKLTKSEIDYISKKYINSDIRYKVYKIFDQFERNNKYVKRDLIELIKYKYYNHISILKYLIVDNLLNQIIENKFFNNSNINYKSMISYIVNKRFLYITTQNLNDFNNFRQKNFLEKTILNFTLIGNLYSIGKNIINDESFNKKILETKFDFNGNNISINSLLYLYQQEKYKSINK